MTDKPNDPSTAAGQPEPEPAQRPGTPVRSPFDSPTEQIDTAGPNRTKEIPRTDEDLGLDPDVPTRAQVESGDTTPIAADAPAPGVAAPGVPAPGADAPSYAFASIPPAPTSPENGRLRRRDDRRGTLDLGLLLLRLVVGGTFIYHGLQKLTGWFHGPGLEGTRDMLEQGGWDQADIGAAFLIVGELGGGILLVLGLGTPLAAGAVLAVILDAWLWKQGMIPGFQYKAAASAVELETVLAGAAAVIILTGPGRLSLDRNRGWATRPFLGSVAALVAAIAAAIGTWLWLHGGNPLTGVGPFD
ncbi:DoxX family protein [Nocardia otitidiscaviarum]|uniref:DoxX family protein n=1 Tax=Nocardia otitidiscaviarum TaxID=1823 RepID=UPI00189356B3|nr:DoxX family protein [Nocardia otitidiscaviarum]MBF6182718.1 DoxX family membrane protein [Nocardia otitidiscaviarum]